MISICFIALGAAIVLVNFWWSRRNLYKLSRNVKCIPGLPILGVSAKLLGNMKDRSRVFLDFFKDFPEIGSIWFGLRLCYLIQKPEFMEIVLNDSGAQEKANFLYKIVRKTINNGLLSAPVDIWRAHRKMLSPAFSQLHINQFSGMINEKTQKIIECLMDDGGDKLTLEQIIVDGTFDLVAATTFQSPNETALANHLNLAQLFHNLFHIGFKQITSIFYQIPFVFKRTKYYLVEKECQMALNRIASDLIEKKLNEKLYEKNGGAEGDARKQKSVVDILLNNHLENKLAMDNLLDHTKTFLLAGTDTVGIALCFFLQMLALHPHVQAKIHAEITDAIIPPSTEILTDHLPKLKYLTSAIKETLRLFPGGPLIAREIQTDIKLNDSITLAAGSVAVLGILPMHRNNCYWPDALKFDPDRFTSATNLGYRWLPFSGGPRNCIGYRYGLMAMKIMAAMLVQNFEFTCDAYEKVEDIEVKVSIVTLPVDGFKVKWHKRTN